MLRQSVSFIVMVGFVTGQMAAFPHAHADGGQPADHDTRPHFHIAWLAHGSHSHDGEHGHHHNADGSHSHSPRTATETEQDEHDKDAVYLPNDIGVSLPNESVGPVNNFKDIATLSIPVAPSTTSVTQCVTGPFFPGDCSPGCPLYLALRALRI